MNNQNSKILITGVAGFIGSEVAKRLISENYKVIGIDNLNSYYDVNLKNQRLKNINSLSKKDYNFEFYKGSIDDEKFLEEVFFDHKPNVVINLAAQAGVRYSIENPMSYLKSNLLGFGNIVEMCRNFKVENFVYASSSSVYGGNKKLPFQESDPVNHPVSLYAATKKSNELIANTYSHLYKIPSTGLRFFTVYGPWGRPDMAPMIFAKAILTDKPIKIFNNGKMRRDFTYIDDVVDGIIRCCNKIATPDSNFDFLNPDPSSSFAPHRLFNLGNNSPIGLLDFIGILEDAIGKKAIKEFEPMQPGDVESTAADISKLNDWVGYKPFTSIEEGISKFVKWYRDFYGY